MGLLRNIVVDFALLCNIKKVDRSRSQKWTGASWSRENFTFMSKPTI